MHALTPGELLNVWESGMTRPPTERALLLLAVACPEISRGDLAMLSIGQRDAELLRLRERLWGTHMVAVASCPVCRERLEIVLETGQLLAQARPSEALERSLVVAGYEMLVRLPTSEDAIAASTEGGSESWRNVLLERCVLSATLDENAVSAHQLPEDVVAGLSEYLAEADPLADIQLDLTCPACEHRWQPAFDVVSFLWTEVEAWASRLLTEVHTLATAYGWSEHEIVNLGPARRQFYLEMVGT